MIEVGMHQIQVQSKASVNESCRDSVSFIISKKHTEIVVDTSNQLNSSQASSTQILTICNCFKLINSLISSIDKQQKGLLKGWILNERSQNIKLHYKRKQQQQQKRTNKQTKYSVRLYDTV